MVAQSSFRRWSGSNDHVYPAEVGSCHVTGERRLKLGQILAEDVDQPSEPPHVHPKVQVRPLHVTRAYVGFIRIATDSGWSAALTLTTTLNLIVSVSHG